MVTSRRADAVGNGWRRAGTGSALARNIGLSEAVVTHTRTGIIRACQNTIRAGVARGHPAGRPERFDQAGCLPPG